MNQTHLTCFIKIVNNNNANDFMIDVSIMTDYRQRISTLKNSYRLYLLEPELYKPIYRFFAMDYSFFVIEKGLYLNLTDARIRRDELIAIEKTKKRWIKPKTTLYPFKQNI